MILTGISALLRESVCDDFACDFVDLLKKSRFKKILTFISFYLSLQTHTAARSRTTNNVRTENAQGDPPIIV